MEEGEEREHIESKAAELDEVDVGYDKGTKDLKQYEEDVFTDRWSRYIGAMGIEAVKKQAESSVLLVGLKAVGLEIAKNLVLSGLKRLTIVEPDVCMDPREHFYMADMGVQPLQECLFKIKELNPYMLVEHSETIPDLSSYTVVVSTLHYNISRDLGQKCREKNIKFIYS